MTIATQYINDQTGNGMAEFSIALSMADIPSGGSQDINIPYLGDAAAVAVKSSGINGTLGISIIRSVGTEASNTDQEIYSGSIDATTTELNGSVSGFSIKSNKITLSNTGGTAGTIYISLISKKKNDGVSTSTANTWTADQTIAEGIKTIWDGYGGGAYIVNGASPSNFKLYSKGTLSFYSNVYKRHNFYGGTNLYLGIYNYLLRKSVSSGITAYAGGGQTNATQLTKMINEVSSVATAGDSVKLPPASSAFDSAGVAAEIKVINNGANAMDLFPSSGEYINNLAVDTAISVAAGSMAIAICYKSGYWKVNII